MGGGRALKDEKQAVFSLPEDFEGVSGVRAKIEGKPSPEKGSHSMSEIDIKLKLKKRGRTIPAQRKKDGLACSKEGVP